MCMRLTVNRVMLSLSAALIAAINPACSSGAPGTLSPDDATQILLATLKGGSYEVTVTAIERPDFLSDRTEVKFDWTVDTLQEPRQAVILVRSRSNSVKKGSGSAEFDREDAGWIVKSLRLDGAWPIS